MQSESRTPAGQPPAGAGALERSRYNHFVERPDGIVAYNARTGTFARLSEEVARMLRGSQPLVESAETALLLEMGFLHRGDELDRIVSTYLGGRVTGGSMHLTIVPTLACNRSCGYCYQNAYRHGLVMSSGTQDATIHYIGARVVEGRRAVGCTFFGGEPLLERSIVLDLARRIRRTVEDAGASLAPMKIVTNGTLLDAGTSKDLAEAGDREAQISFDALIDDGRDHRGVVDASGEPSTILRHVIAAVPHLKVRIRINVTVSNRAHVPEMLEILRAHGLDGLAYLARVTDLEGEAGAVTDSEGRRRRLPIVHPSPSPDTLSRPDFALLEQGAVLEQTGALAEIARRLTPKQHFCGATAGNLFVIDPEGNISRCWSSAGARSEALGNVHEAEGDLADTEVGRAWSRFSPFVYAHCSSCRVLPLCMGGCSHPRLMMGAKAPPCEAIKQQIVHFVEHLGKRLVIQKSPETGEG